MKMVPQDHRSTSMSAQGRHGVRNRVFMATAAMGVLAIFACPGRGYANPLGPVVSPTVTHAPTITGVGTANVEVTLGQARTILDWKSFNIAPGEGTKFVFGDKNWIVLNRVGTVDPTVTTATINGNLRACLSSACVTYGGNVWIYAPNGVIFGPNASVTTGGLLATTVPMATSDAAFATGKETPANSFNFAAPTSGPAATGSVTVQNGASIKGNGSTVAFIAPQVNTEAGSSVTNTDGKGSVLYGAASAYRIQFQQTASNDLDLFSFEVPAATDGSGSTAPLNLAGYTSAGKVYAAAVTKSSVAGAMISSSGTVIANQASAEGGNIVLSAGGGITATAPTAPVGGAVKATITGDMNAGNQITLNSSDHLDASGAILRGSAVSDVTKVAGSTVNGAVMTNAGNKITNLGDFTNSGSGDLTVSTSKNLTVTGTVTNTVGRTSLSTVGDMNFATTANVNAAGQTLQLTAGGIVNQDGGSVTAGSLTGTSSVGVDMLSPTNNIAALDSFTVTNSGNFFLADAAPLTINGTLSVPQRILFEDGAAGGVTVNAVVTSTTDRRVSFLSDALAINPTAAINGGTLEYAPFTSGATFTLGAGGQLIDTHSLNVARIRVGAITDPVSGNTVISAGNIGINSFNAVGRDVELDGLGAITESGTGLQNVGTLLGVADSADLTNAHNTITSVRQFSVTNDFALSNSQALDARMITAGGAVHIDTLQGGQFSLAVSDITAGGDVVLGGKPVNISGDITSGGTVTLNSPGDVTQFAGVIMANTVSGLVTGSAVLTGANKVGTLTNFTAGSGLVFNDTQDLTVSNVAATGLDLGITTTGQLDAGGVSAGRNMNLTAGELRLDGDATSGRTMTLVATAGDVSQESGIVTATTLTGSATGNASLLDANKVGTFQNFTAAGFVDFNSAIDLVATGVQSSGAEVTITTSSGSLSAGDITGGYAVTLTGATSLDLSGNVTASQPGATISLDALGGSITQSGGIITATYLSELNAAGDIALTRANQVDALDDIAIAGSLTFNDAKDLTIQGLTTGGALKVSTTGALRVSNVYSDQGVAGATIDLTGASIREDLDITANGTGVGIGPVTLTATAGDINQVSGVITAGNLSGSASGSINLGGANKVQTLGNTAFGSGLTAGNAVIFNNAQDLTVNEVEAGGDIVLSSTGILATRDLATNSYASVDSSGGNISLTGASLVLQNIDTNDTLTLTAKSGGIIQDGGVITAPTLTGSAGGGVNIQNANLVDVISGFTAGSYFFFTDAENLTLSAPLATPGNVSIVSSGLLTTNGISGGSSVALAGSGLQLNGNVSATGDLFLTATASDITQSNNLSAINLSVNATNGAVTLNGDNNFAGIELHAKNDISFHSAGDLTVYNAKSAAGSVTITSAAGLTTTADPFGTTGVPSSIVAAKNVTLSGTQVRLNADISAGGTVALTALTTDVEQQGGIISAGVLTGSSTGNFYLFDDNKVGTIQNVTAGGFADFNNAGPLTASNIKSASAEVTLQTGSGNLSAGGVSGLYAVTLTAAAALDIAGDVSTNQPGGTVKLSALGGGITQSGGAITTSYLNQLKATGDIALTGANQADVLDQTSITGNLTFNNAKDLTIQGLAVGGALKVTTTGALNVSNVYSSDGIAAATVDLTGASIRFDLDSTSTGATTLKSTAGDVYQTSGIIMAPTLSGSASGSLDLEGANKVGALSGFTAGMGLTFNDAQDYTASSLLAANGTVNLTAPGGLTVNLIQGQAVQFQAQKLSISNTKAVTGGVTATGATIAANNVQAGTDVTLQGTTVSAKNVLAGGNVTATGTDVTVEGVQASGSVTATASNALTAGNILAGNGVTLTGAAVTLDNSVTANAGSVQLTATDGDIRQTGGIITAATLTGSSTGVTDLEGANQVDALTGFATGDNLTFSDYRDLTASNLTLHFGTLTLGARALTVGDIDVARTDFSAVSINLVGNIVVGDPGEPESGLFGFSMNASNGIIQTGGTITAGDLYAQAGGDLILSGDNHIDLISSSSAGGNMVIHNATGIEIADAGAAKALTITANGAIGISPMAIDGLIEDFGPGSSGAGTTLSLSGTSITVNAGLAGKAITLTATAGDISEGYYGKITTPVLNGSATGTVNFAPTTQLHPNMVASVSGFNAATGFVLNDGTDLDVAQLQSNSISLKSTGTLTVHGVTGTGTQDVTLTAPHLVLAGNVTSGNAVILDGGDAVQTGGVINAKDLAGTLTGSADLEGANKVQQLGAMTVGTNLTFHNAGDLAVSDFAQATSGTLSLSSDGTLTVLYTSNPKEVFGGTAVKLSGHDIELGGNVASTGTVSITATAGDVFQGSGIIAAHTLTGSATGDAEFLGENLVDTLSNFTAGSSFYFVNDKSLTASHVATTDPDGSVYIEVDSGDLTAGDIDPGDITLVSAGALNLVGDITTGSASSGHIQLFAGSDITQTGGTLTGGFLTGDATGAVSLGTLASPKANQIGELDAFTAGGSFSLTDGRALVVAGTPLLLQPCIDCQEPPVDPLQEPVQRVTVTNIPAGIRIGGDITLTAAGDLTFITANAIVATDAAFINPTAARTTIGLFSTGNISQQGGYFLAPRLTGYSSGSTSLTQSGNTISELDAFNTGGGFAFTDSSDLLVTGTLLFGEGVPGIFAGSHGVTATGGNIAVTVTGSGNSLTTDTADALITAGAAQTVTLAAAQDIVINNGTITAGAVDLIAGQVSSSQSSSNQLTSQSQGTPGNILIGDKVFTDAAATALVSDIDSLATATKFFGTIDPPASNHVYVATAALDMAAGGRIVGENTGTQNTTGGSFNPNGIAITPANTTATAVEISGHPTAIGLFGTLSTVAAPLLVANSAQVVLGSDTPVSQDYRINGCVIHNASSCGASSGSGGNDGGNGSGGAAVIDLVVVRPQDNDTRLDPIQFVSPTRQVDQRLLTASQDEDDELDLSITGAGNDELWQDAE